MKKLFASLVTVKPPKEIKGKDVIAESLQELSNLNPVLAVPQGDGELDDRIRKILLFDQALTPGDMPGAFGIPSWALDTARTIRAAQAAKLESHGKDSKLKSDALGAIMSRYGSNHVQAKAAIQRLAATGVLSYDDIADGLPNLESWSDCVTYASGLAREAEQRKEPPISPPPGGGGNGGGKDSGDDDSESDSDSPPSPPERCEKPKPKPDDKGDEESPESIGWESKSDEQVEAEAVEDRLFDGGVSGDPWSPSSIPKDSDCGAKPGKLENPDSPDKLPMHVARKKGVRRRSELDGNDPVNLHRLHIDGKIFRGAKVRGGSKGRGTVLVDLSTSMSWSESDFQYLLDSIPECSVYGYYGRGTSGRWCILADRGRVASREAVYEWKGGGSNIVDVPVLEKLSRLPMPRVWLSDGGATGVHDRRSEYIIKRVAEICSRGSIVRCRTAKQATDYILTGKAKGVKRGAACTVLDGLSLDDDLAYRDRYK